MMGLLFLIKTGAVISIHLFEADSFYDQYHLISSRLKTDRVTLRLESATISLYQPISTFHVSSFHLLVFHFATTEYDI